MARWVVAFILCSASAHAAVVRSASFLATDSANGMRPEVVANTLATVEDEWKAQATAFLGCSAGDCGAAPESFARSCSTVVSAVVQGSGGDREVAREYMDKVCDQKSLKDWHKIRCNELAVDIVEGAMSADNYANRENLNPSNLCAKYWTKFVTMEQKRLAEEAKVRAEREKKEAAERAEREKKEAEERAEAEKKAAVEAEKREKEEKERKEKEERTRVADEARARAAEAAAKLAQKKAEAEAVQKAAQQKLEEAAKAEQEHKEQQAKQKEAEELLRNTTQAKKTKVQESSKNAAPASKSTAQVAKPSVQAVNVTAAANATKVEAVPKKEAKSSAKNVTK